MTPEELAKVESIINAEVAADDPVTVKEMSYDDAMKTGALAFFDEKYGDKVRVVKIAGKAEPFSVELCGGTHLSRTSEVGFFKITSESSVASGVRRIEAITSTTAYQFLEQRSEWYQKVENLVAAKGDLAFQKLQQLVSANKNLQKEIESLKLKVAQGGAQSKGDGAGALHDKAKPVDGTDLKLVAERVPGVGPKILRTLVDQVRDKLKEKTVVALAGDENGKVALCVGLTKDLVGRFDSGKLIQPMAKLVGGTGGGRADFAQAGGADLNGVDAALSSLKDALKG
jgi:alanyl-tRNA synthetase